MLISATINRENYQTTNSHNLQSQKFGTTQFLSYVVGKIDFKFT